MSRVEKEGAEIRWFAAIWVPDFELQAVGRLEKSLEGRPLALLEEAGRKVVIGSVDARARAGGVCPGMTAAQAVARCPDVVLRSRSPEAMRSGGDVLLAMAFTLSPRVEKTAEGLCTIDLRGTSGGRLRGRGERLAAELGKLGFDVRVGFAKNPLLAFFAARRADPVLEVSDAEGFLRDLPVAVAEPSAKLADILRQWGIRTFGALTALSREDVAKRLGSEGIALWDRACGHGKRVLRLAALPEVFEERLELEYEVETLEPLLFVLRRFVDQLALRLRAGHRVAGEVRLELKLTDGSCYDRTFRLPEPTGNPNLLFRMLQTHLEGVRTEFPIVEIYLRAEPCRPVSCQQDLFEAAVKDPHAFADTLARLVAVVGSGNVGSPRLMPTHRPDAFRLVPLATIEPGAEGVETGNGMPSMRRFRPPLVARVLCEEGCPVHVSTNGIYGRIRQAVGPWRLSGNWWEPTWWSRDEWDVGLENGGRYRLVRERKQWFLEGEYG